MIDRARLIDLHLQMLSELGWSPPTGDVIDDIRDGGLLTVSQAAIVCGRDEQTIYRWLDDDARKRRPLGLKKATTWMIGTERLLDYVEKYKGGLPARREAETRLKRYWPIWSQQQELSTDV